MKKRYLFIILFLAVFLFVNNVEAKEKTVTDSLPDSVDRKTQFRFNGGSGERGSIDYDTTDDNEYLLYSTDVNNAVAMNGDVLTKDAKIDYGLVHILKNSYPTKEIVTGVVGYSTTETPTFNAVCNAVGNKMVNIYITQNAIWNYQQSINKVYTESMTFSDNDSNLCRMYEYDGKKYADVPFDEYTNYNKDFATLLWDNYVTKLVAEARNVKDPAEATLTLAMENKWTEEDNVYKSSLITVSSSNSEAVVNNYQLSLQNAPTGTKVYTESGNEITASLSNIAAGTKVYITVPTSEVKNGSANFTLNAKANIKYDAAYKYVDKVNNHQPSVLVGPETKDIAGSINLTITPDTASMISKSIYFIGFIILLSGAGILYANLKTKEQ